MISKILTGTDSNIAVVTTVVICKHFLRGTWERVQGQLFACETCVSQVEGRNAEPVKGYVMLYVQNAHVNDIAVLMPKVCI